MCAIACLFWLADYLILFQELEINLVFFLRYLSEFSKHKCPLFELLIMHFFFFCAITGTETLLVGWLVPTYGSEIWCLTIKTGRISACSSGLALVNEMTNAELQQLFLMLCDSLRYLSVRMPKKRWMRSRRRSICIIRIYGRSHPSPIAFDS